MKLLIGVLLTFSGHFFDFPPADENVSSSVIRSFNKMFSNVESAKWNATGKDVTVKFSQDNVAYHVFYNKKGKWLATIQTLPLEHLPKWVNARVKSDFGNYSVFLAQHVKTPAAWTYLVKIEKGKDWKIVKINREATEVVGEYVRN